MRTRVIVRTRKVLEDKGEGACELKGCTVVLTKVGPHPSLICSAAETYVLLNGCVALPATVSNAAIVVERQVLQEGLDPPGRDSPRGR